MMKPPEVSYFRGLHHIDCDFAFSDESAWNRSHSTITNQFCLEIIYFRVCFSFDSLIYPYYPAYIG